MIIYVIMLPSVQVCVHTRVCASMYERVCHSDCRLSQDQRVKLVLVEKVKVSVLVEFLL